MKYSLITNGLTSNHHPFHRRHALVSPGIPGLFLGNSEVYWRFDIVVRRTVVGFITETASSDTSTVSLVMGGVWLVISQRQLPEAVQ